MVIWVQYKGKKSKRLTGGTKLQSSGQRKDVYNAVEQDQIFQTCTCTGCLDVWIPGCLSPGHLHSHHFFNQTAAAPSLERKLAVAVDPQITESWRMEFPKSLGGFGNQVDLRSLNPALFCGNQWLEQSTCSRWTTCLCVISKWKF